jgi:hypothetical protein
MATEKRYLHDRFVLLLLSVSAFLAVSGSLLVLLRLTQNRANGYIVEYRENLGVSAFRTGNFLDMLAFVVFLFLIVALHTILSRRIYHTSRPYALFILGLGILLLCLGIIVSNALLVLR